MKQSSVPLRKRLWRFREKLLDFCRDLAAAAWGQVGRWLGGPLSGRPRGRRLLQLEPLETRTLLSVVQFHAAAWSAHENAQSATITVDLDQAAAATVTVGYSTSDGTAVAGI